ncbi:MAG TPA: hypothetical protein VKV04_24610 [Verrucomicrobiae bacterium]|nr:hypothetical protein [Verrucomicrobiae bacterium]
MSEQARIALTVKGNTFEISGPEAFVTAQAEAFREAIISSLSSGAGPAEEDVTPGAEPPAAPHHAPTNNQQRYPNVLHIEGDKVQILKGITGTTNSKKVVGTTVVYLWAKREMGVDSVPFSELRDVCRQHGCLDGANFGSTMKNAREWIVVDGKSGSPLQTCKLTIPGVEKAEAILKDLNGEQQSA